MPQDDTAKLGSDPAKKGPPADGRQEPIPGAYEANTATHREPGSMGGRFNGADSVSSGPHDLMDDLTEREHRREGGGGKQDR